MGAYLNDLVGHKKKTRYLFRWKVVEAYRAERVQASQLEQTLGISIKELRRLNRHYFRYHLLPLLQPKPRHKTMERNADYVKMLGKKLTEMEKENQFLCLQTEARQTVIQITEEQFNIPIVKKLRRCGQGAEELTRRLIGTSSEVDYRLTTHSIINL